MILIRRCIKVVATPPWALSMCGPFFFFVERLRRCPFPEGFHSRRWKHVLLCRLLGNSIVSFVDSDFCDVYWRTPAMVRTIYPTYDHDDALFTSASCLTSQIFPHLFHVAALKDLWKFSKRHTRWTCLKTWSLPPSSTSSCDCPRSSICPSTSLYGCFSRDTAALSLHLYLSLQTHRASP